MNIVLILRFSLRNRLLALHYNLPDENNPDEAQNLLGQHVMLLSRAVRAKS